MLVFTYRVQNTHSDVLLSSHELFSHTLLNRFSPARLHDVHKLFINSSFPAAPNIPTIILQYTYIAHLDSKQYSISNISTDGKRFK